MCKLDKSTKCLTSSVYCGIMYNVILDFKKGDKIINGYKQDTKKTDDW